LCRRAASPMVAMQMVNQENNFVQSSAQSDIRTGSKRFGPSAGRGLRLMAPNFCLFFASHDSRVTNDSPTSTWKRQRTSPPFFKVAPDSNLFNSIFPQYIFLCRPEKFFKRPIYNFFSDFLDLSFGSVLGQSCFTAASWRPATPLTQWSVVVVDIHFVSLCVP
jgi:hypothetical protein